MKWTILLLLYILMAGCAREIPECPCKQIPEEQTQQNKSIQSTEIYSGLNAKIDAQIKMVEGKGKLEAAFKNLSELRSDYFTRLGFNHDEVKQYNLIVNQLCNVWRNMYANNNDTIISNTCRAQYLEGLQAMQQLIRKAAPSISLNEFLGKAEKEIATIQLEMESKQQPNATADLDAVIAQIRHLQNRAKQDSSQVEFCNGKLETITQTNKKYQP